MRTNIEIDDQLMRKALKVSGLKTKREVVDAALRRFVQMGAQRKLLGLFGKVRWEGDLDQMRGPKKRK